MKAKESISEKINKFKSSNNYIESYEYNENSVFVSLGNDTVMEIPFSCEILNIIKNIYDNQSILLNKHFPFLHGEIDRVSKKTSVLTLALLVNSLVAVCFLVFGMVHIVFLLTVLSFVFVGGKFSFHNILKTLKNNELQSFNNLKKFDENDSTLRRAVIEIYENQKSLNDNAISMNMTIEKSINEKNGGKTRVITPLVNK